LYDFLLVIFLIDFLQSSFLIYALPVQLGRVMYVQLYDVQMVLVGQLVQDVILRLVKYLRGIQFLVFFQKLINLGYVPALKQHSVYLLGGFVCFFIELFLLRLHLKFQGCKDDFEFRN
jgi:hypothetical protein